MEEVEDEVLEEYPQEHPARVYLCIEEVCCSICMKETLNVKVCKRLYRARSGINSAHVPSSLTFPSFFSQRGRFHCIRRHIDTHDE